jgi:hypothetical protein
MNVIDKGKPTDGVAILSPGQKLRLGVGQNMPLPKCTVWCEKLAILAVQFLSESVLLGKSGAVVVRGYAPASGG